ncbi:MAG: GMC family oxidoreductase N-terminal domain-containing protein, partial [Alphaproteobacteria bacterium]|nr:GMC family oxidoreductase N-terminal domain-containing protein [Alphaproteobacteria bacterium]
GTRCSTAKAWLGRARGRPNLEVRTHALAQRVLVCGTRAVGVDYRQRGRLRRAEAGEVILCGGAVNSPQLLMLSGIGPADQLRAHGITVRNALEGVGANLQDHLDICTLQRSTEAISYDRANDVAVALEFLLHRRGIGTSNIAECGGFIRSSLAPETPDIQLHFIPAYVIDHARVKPGGHGMTLHACVLRPQSRGEIRLASADPLTPPAIDPNYLERPYDLKVLIDGIRRGREIFATRAFRPFVGPERDPGGGRHSDEELADYIAGHAETEYHPVGTCRMGHDEMAVVDDRLRVRGIDGLRVVDASIMPTVVSGNTNAPAIMIGEKGAAMIAAA